MSSICIGLPVFNGEKTIAAVLDSLLAQTYQNFFIIISDNDSTDETGTICKKYAHIDKRITYIRQEKNIGAVENFKFVFKKTNCKYFLWAASDDIRSYDFLEKNFNFLELHDDYLASTLQTKFQGRNLNSLKMGDASLDQNNFAIRILNFFDHWHANGRFYSLFRRDAVAQWINKDWDFLGGDWYLVLYIASMGKTNCIHEGYTELGRDGASNTTDIFSAYRKSFKHWLIPFYELSFHAWNLMKSAKNEQKITLLIRLITLNAQAFIIQHKVIVKIMLKNNFYAFFKKIRK